jgi:phage terminase small subunit
MLANVSIAQAAIRAGYAAKNAQVTGPRMLGNVRVAQEVEKLQKERADTKKRGGVA